MPSYLVVAHADMPNLVRLCSRLPLTARVFVHVDGKVTDAEYRWARARLPAASFVEPRRRVSWSSFAMVRAELDLIRPAVAVTDPDDHLVLLSGADYPLRPVEDFERFLADAPFRQHIRAFAIEGTDRKYTMQIDRRWWMDELVGSRRGDRLIRKTLNETAGRLARRTPPNRAVQGLTWWALTAGCARHVLDTADETPELARFYSHTWCPDEKFVHSIVHASRFAAETRDGGLADYQGPGQWRLSNFHLIDRELAKVWSVDDLDAVRGSDQFFIRKVSTGKSASLLDWIDQERLAAAAVAG